ncbi:hypothetical protein MASR1M32_38310 [Rhodobacter sp.]
MPVRPVTARYVVMAPNGAGRLVSMAAMVVFLFILLKIGALCFRWQRDSLAAGAKQAAPKQGGLAAAA